MYIITNEPMVTVISMVDSITFTPSSPRCLSRDLFGVNMILISSSEVKMYIS